MSAKNRFHLKIGKKNEINSIGKCNKQNAHATIHSLQPNWLNAKVISQSIFAKCSRTDRLYETVLCTFIWWTAIQCKCHLNLFILHILFNRKIFPSVVINDRLICPELQTKPTFCCHILIQDKYDRVWSGKDLMSPPPYYYSLSYQTSQTFAFDQSSIINGLLLLSGVFTLVVVYATQWNFICDAFLWFFFFIPWECF